MQRTGASRFAQRQIERHRRLAPVADLCVRPLDITMRQAIESAVQLMRSNPKCAAREMFQLLLDSGIDRPVAAQLLVLVPHAYGRVGLDGCGVLFSDT